MKNKNAKQQKAPNQARQGNVPRSQKPKSDLTGRILIIVGAVAAVAAVVLVLYLVFSGGNRNADAGPDTPTVTEQQDQESTGTQAENPLSALSGKYICTMLDSDGLAMDPSLMGLEIYLTLQDDGTGIIQYADVAEADAERFTWTLDDSGVHILSEVRNRDGVIQDGKIVLDDDGAAFTFEKLK